MSRKMEDAITRAYIITCLKCGKRGPVLDAGLASKPAASKAYRKMGWLDGWCPVCMSPKAVTDFISKQHPVVAKGAIEFLATTTDLIIYTHPEHEIAITDVQRKGEHYFYAQVTDRVTGDVLECVEFPKPTIAGKGGVLCLQRKGNNALVDLLAATRSTFDSITVK